MQIRYRGHTLEITVATDRLKVTALDSPNSPIQIGLRHTLFYLHAGETKEISE